MSIRKIGVLSILMLVSSAATAASVNEPMKVSAKLEKKCTIQVDDVQLGVLSSEKNLQSFKNFEMNVVCNKGSAYSLRTLLPAKIPRPDNPSTMLLYTYTMPYVGDTSVSDFVGYRILMGGSSAESRKYFGDGSVHNGVQTQKHSNVGSGFNQKISFVIEYYMYFSIKAGNYATTHTVAVDY